MPAKKFSVEQIVAKWPVVIKCAGDTAVLLSMRRIRQSTSRPKARLMTGSSNPSPAS
jgi:hypothetical protein